MKQWLAPAHLALTLVIIVWSVILAGRIAQLRQASRPFAAINGLAALLLIPAFMVAIATTTVITGRAIASIDWLWPVTIVLFAAQAVFAVSQRLVNPLWGYPIAFYNVLIAIAALTRYFVAHGYVVPRPFQVLMAAEMNALVLVTTAAAMTSPLFLHAPLIAPAFPALSRWTGSFRMGMSVVAIAWVAVILAEVPRADVALASYERHTETRLTERPGGFVLGLKMFPDVDRPPSAASVRNDLEVADALGVSVAHVVFAPGASLTAIDSVAKSLDLLRRDSLVVIATIGYHGKLFPHLGIDPLNTERRLATLHRVLERLRPDIVVPAQDPYGIGARVHGRLPVEAWQRYHTQAAALVKRVRPRTRVALAASAFDARDSTLYAWAASPDAPVDIVGFSFYPTRLGARSMDADMRAADRWLRAHPPTKPHWVFGAGGYPLAHGELSQDRALWATLVWATGHPQVRGLVITEASDYGQAMGMRAPNGRYRAATTSVQRAHTALRETYLAPATPTR